MNIIRKSNKNSVVYKQMTKRQTTKVGTLYFTNVHTNINTQCKLRNIYFVK